MPYTRQVTLFDGLSGSSSSFTSGWHLVADYDNLFVSWSSSVTDASTLTIQGTNDNIITAAPVNISNVTGIVLAGIYTVEPGMFALRAQRSVQSSRDTVVMNFKAR